MDRQSAVSKVQRCTKEVPVNVHIHNAQEKILVPYTCTREDVVDVYTRVQEKVLVM